MSSRSRYTKLGVSLSGLLLAAAACGGGAAGYHLTGATKASAATTHAKTATAHAKTTTAHTNGAAGSGCDHGADARR